MSGIVLLFICVLSSASASYLLKSSAGASSGTTSIWAIAFNPMVVAGALCYAASFGAYVFALQKVQLSLAQPVITAGVSVVTALVSVLLLRETMSLVNWAGLILVCAGISLLSWGKI